MSSAVASHDRLEAVLRGGFSNRLRAMTEFTAIQPSVQQPPRREIQQAPRREVPQAPRREIEHREIEHTAAAVPAPKENGATRGKDVKMTMASARTIAQSYAERGGEVIDLFSAFAGVVFTEDSAMALRCLEATDRWVSANDGKPI